MNLGVLSTIQLKEMCSIWNVDPVSMPSADWTSNIPTLLLSGENDPVTPPEYGDLALSQLRSATHLVVSGTAHNTIHNPCIYEMVTDFYQSLNSQELDTKCASELKRPPFILSATGTSP
jgi:pimeloyl-ACP methyl ester carboxylesterase